MRPGVQKVVAPVIPDAFSVLILTAILSTILIRRIHLFKRQRVAIVARSARHARVVKSILASRAVRPRLAVIIPTAHATATVPVVAVVVRAARLADTGASQGDREARRRAQGEATQHVPDGGRSSEKRGRRGGGAPPRGGADRGRSQRAAQHRQDRDRDRPGESPGTVRRVHHRALPASARRKIPRRVYARRRGRGECRENHSSVPSVPSWPLKSRISPAKPSQQAVGICARLDLSAHSRATQVRRGSSLSRSAPAARVQRARVASRARRGHPSRGPPRFTRFRHRSTATSLFSPPRRK